MNGPKKTNKKTYKRVRRESFLSGDISKGSQNFLYLAIIISLFYNKVFNNQSSTFMCVKDCLQDFICSNEFSKTQLLWERGWYNLLLFSTFTNINTKKIILRRWKYIYPLKPPQCTLANSKAPLFIEHFSNPTTQIYLYILTSE